jgi:sugar lactone lactonase YvrE
MRSALVIIVPLLGIAGCTAERPEEGPQRLAQPATVAGAGFATPESVLHDAEADVYLVSNINGNPLEKDDNGFISRVAPDGSVASLKWIDGAAPGVTLHAPKGMTIKGDTLFVADIDVVRIFERTSGAPLGERPIPGATFLNDMATGPDGRVYVTDTGVQAGASGFEPSGTAAVWRFAADGEPEALVRGEPLGGPNGIVVTNGRLLVVGFATGAVTFVDTATGQIQAVPKPPAGQLDGVVRTAAGQHLISSWEGQTIYRMAAAGQYESIVDSIEAPADIGYDSTRNTLMIPLFMANEVRIIPLQQ